MIALAADLARTTAIPSQAFRRVSLPTPALSVVQVPGTQPCVLVLPTQCVRSTQRLNRSQYEVRSPRPNTVLPVPSPPMTSVTRPGGKPPKVISSNR